MKLFLILAMLLQAADDAEPKTIPLDQIWAYKMPGTKDIGVLDAVKTATGTTRHPIINVIHSALTDWPKKGDKAGPGFVVEGTGELALKKAAAVLKERATPPRTFSPNTDLSIVFYSYMCARYVQLVSVEKTQKHIVLKYRFVAHATADMTSHIALIPIGKFPEGKVHVTIEQVPSIDDRGNESPPLIELQRLICRSFSFEVQQ